MIKLKHKQCGLSLIELMVAIGLSMVLSLGVIQIFSSSKQTSRVQDSLARLQENARFALDLLAHDIRMAGQLGCNSNASLSYADQLTNHGASIFGYEHDDLPANSALVSNKTAPKKNKVIAGTDTILVLSASTSSIPVNSTATTVSAMTAGAFADIDSGDPLLISDCENADIFIANKEDNSVINISAGNFSKSYDDYSQLAPLNYSAYYIREKDNQNNLYRSIVNGIANNTGFDTDPLLEGIEDMQILYGEDINGDGSSIRYVAADTAGLDMSKVRSVRIHLLLATLEDNLASEPQGYWFAGELVQPAEGSTDRRLFRSFTTTIQLRNQGINS